MIPEYRQIDRMRRVMANLLLLSLMLAPMGCGAPAQIGDDEEAFNEIDALYTAVTSKNLKLLSECRARLEKLKDEDKLSTSAFEAVKPIMDEAEKGGWTNAAPKLYTFMRGQRREPTR